MHIKAFPSAEVGGDPRTLIELQITDMTDINPLWCNCRRKVIAQFREVQVEDASQTQ